MNRGIKSKVQNRTFELRGPGRSPALSTFSFLQAVVTVRHMTGHLTPQKAAKRAGVGRTTIMRALERNELKAMRDNSGRWQITLKALDDWMSMRPVRSYDRQSPSTVTDSDHGQELAAAKVEIATLTSQKEGLEARLCDTQTDRDAWRTQAQRLASEARPIGMIERIFGRR